MAETPENPKEQNAVASASRPKSTSEFGDELSIKMVDIFRVPYFEKMFNGGFKEANDLKAYLPDDGIGTFHLFLEWLYRGALRPADMAKHTTTSGPLFNRVKLYCFAEKICSTELMDYTMTELVALYRKNYKLVSIPAVEWIYESTSPESLLRKFAALSYIRVVSKGVEEKWPMSLVAETLRSSGEPARDVLQLMRSGETGSEPPSMLDPCHFHHHKQGADCPYYEDRA
ncbi:uncharacterized protein PAC_07343 [Phialocephala subalpina]|uniref:Uncharacterized protein n=1 Tax=Phialocephala subalpina TaxID=576137 RepID=A0A1L7WXF8_9HELO|nr:uncharacterized protein PAC_07343 [Phialocephala subalpina]